MRVCIQKFHNASFRKIIDFKIKKNKKTTTNTKCHKNDRVYYLFVIRYIIIIRLIVIVRENTLKIEIYFKFHYILTYQRWFQDVKKTISISSIFDKFRGSCLQHVKYWFNIVLKTITAIFKNCFSFKHINMTSY